MTPNIDEMLVTHAVSQTVYRVARAIDRCDRVLLDSCFWPDATDNHVMFKGTASGFAAWVMELLPQAFEHTQHFIGNLLVEHQGDKARSEAYFMAYHRVVRAGMARDMIAAGRYLDTFTCRQGEWRISHRQAVYDWAKDEPASDDAWTKPPLADLLERGRRGVSDLVYSDL